MVVVSSVAVVVGVSVVVTGAVMSSFIFSTVAPSSEGGAEAPSVTGSTFIVGKNGGSVVSTVASTVVVESSVTAFVVEGVVSLVVVVVVVVLDLKNECLVVDDGAGFDVVSPVLPANTGCRRG